MRGLWRHRRLVASVLLVAVIVVGAGVAWARLRADEPLPPGSGRVVSVTDGDTIRVRIGGDEERVRLIGIDTPETHGQGGLRECFGQEATEETKRILPEGTVVRLVRDVEARDRYGRLLAYVYRAGDGLFVNLALAEHGFAAAYTYPPNVAHADAFVAAAGRARHDDRGLWSRCGGPDKEL